MTDQIQKQYSNLIASINKVSYLLNKHDHIRLKHWLDKLASPMNNSIWKQNRNLYLKILLEMTTFGELMKPFNQSPPEGPLPKITIYDVPYPIRIKLSQQDHRLDKNTPSQHKTSYHSRKNSLSASGNALSTKVQRSLSKQNKKQNNIMQHKKKIIFDQKSIDSSKQNKNYMNENIREKSNSQSSKYYNQKQQFGFRAKAHIKNKEDFSNTLNNSTCKFAIQQFGEQDHNIRFKAKGCQILKKSLKFLAKYADQFGHSIRYKQILEQIVQAGDKLGQNFREVSIPSIDQVQKIDKYNQRIKNKFLQTDQNTIEFMNYLNSLS